DHKLVKGTAKMGMVQSDWGNLPVGFEGARRKQIDKVPQVKSKHTVPIVVDAQRYHRRALSYLLNVVHSIGSPPRVQRKPARPSVVSRSTEHRHPFMSWWRLSTQAIWCSPPTSSAS